MQQRCGRPSHQEYQLCRCSGRKKSNPWDKTFSTCEGKGACRLLCLNVLCSNLPNGVTGAIWRGPSGELVALNAQCEHWATQ